MNKPGRRRTEITVETHSLTIIRTRGAKSDFVYCRNCRTKAAVFSRSHASLIFRVDSSELERLCQNSQIHYASADALCGDSLAGFFKKEIRYVEN